MSRVYSVRMAIGVTPAATPVVIYTCPPFQTAIVRDIDVLPPPGIVTAFSAYVNGAATIFQTVGATPVVTAHWRGRVVLSPGDTLTVLSAAAAWQYCVSGYELDA